MVPEYEAIVSLITHANTESRCYSRCHESGMLFLQHRMISILHSMRLPKIRSLAHSSFWPLARHVRGIVSAFKAAWFTRSDGLRKIASADTPQKTVVVLFTRVGPCKTSSRSSLSQCDVGQTLRCITCLLCHVFWQTAARPRVDDVKRTTVLENN